MIHKATEKHILKSCCHSAVLLVVGRRSKVFSNMDIQLDWQLKCSLRTQLLLTELRTHWTSHLSCIFQQHKINNEVSHLGAFYRVTTHPHIELNMSSKFNKLWLVVELYQSKCSSFLLTRSLCCTPPSCPLSSTHRSPHSHQPDPVTCICQAAGLWSMEDCEVYY